MTDRYRHKVRGTTYRVLYEAAKASSVIEALDHMTMVVYQCEDSGHVWVRPAIEFFDGRFERIADIPQTPWEPSEDDVMPLLRNRSEGFRDRNTNSFYKDGIGIDRPNWDIMQFARAVAALALSRPDRSGGS